MEDEGALGHDTAGVEVEAASEIGMMRGNATGRGVIRGAGVRRQGERALREDPGVHDSLVAADLRLLDEIVRPLEAEVLAPAEEEREVAAIRATVAAVGVAAPAKIVDEAGGEVSRDDCPRWCV